MRSLLSIVPMLGVLVGCVSSPNENEPRAVVAGGAGQILRVEGESVVLGQAASAPLSLESFVAKVQQSAVAGRDEAAGQLVRTYPDLAQQAALSRHVDSRAQQAISAWLDGIASPDRGGWSLLVADRVENPWRYASWEEQRESAWAALRSGAFDEVADADLSPPDDGPTLWPVAEAAGLRASAMLAAGRPAEAAKHFEQSAERAKEWDSRYAARASLFAAFSYQLAGLTEAASRVRAEAVGVTTVEAMHDPVSLRLLIETKPSGPSFVDGFSLRAIRARLGRVELERGVPQAALLAWRAAEADSGAEPTLDRLRLGQAEALIALGQEQPAVAMLAGLASTDARSEALVMLGLVQMRRGQVDIAIAVLREAVENTTAQAQPEVYADVGLALLSAGNREVGLALLHEARDVYRARGETSALLQLLTNELRYAQAVEDASLVSRVRTMLMEVRP